MGSIRIRYASGDEDEWELHDAMDFGRACEKVRDLVLGLDDELRRRCEQ